jgi:RNA recognition motif-containing protein
MKLFVGNLPFSTTEAELSNMFAAHGEVSSTKIITDRDTGRPRGFGFVEFSDSSAGEAAIKNLNGAMLNGRAIVVNEARPQERRGGGSGGYGGGGYGGGRDGGGYGGRDEGGYGAGRGGRDRDRGGRW